MIKIRLILFLSLVTLTLQAQLKSELFDNDWRFFKGGALGAENPDFDDAVWRTLDLPHDWSIEDLPGLHTPFKQDAISSVGGGFTTGGTGWYRKSFTPVVEAGARTVIQFDGVYMNADVWLNGTLLGSHPYGYTSFWFDITGLLKPGQKNTIAVKVKNEGETSRWYSGSGIYRHVWMQTTGPVHVAHWGVAVTTAGVTEKSATIDVMTTVAHLKEGKDIRVVSTLVNAQGTAMGKAESKPAGGDTAVVKNSFALNTPQLWSLEKPVLYSVISEVFSGNQLTDRVETPFGIRDIKFTAAQGFQLNGKSIKLKGGCVHHDHGPLGSKSFDRAEFRKIELLKASGFNAIRCSHNPPAPAFLEACDKLGMLVIDEAFDIWQEGKNPYDYHLFYSAWWQRDVASMVLRDRNHPSVILWSIGNEIPGMEDPAIVKQAKAMSDYVHSLDASRPVTAAVNGLSEKKDPYFATLDISGYNYAAGGDHNQKSIYQTDHERIPGRIMFGSESYAWEAFGSWMGVVDHPWVIGDFVWTAYDYIGEASIGWLGYWQEQKFYPWSLAYCGDIDICGWKRPQSYYRDALWGQDKLSVFVTPPQPSFPLNPKKESWSKWDWHDVVTDWSWKGQEGKPFEVTVYSSCEQAELFLNGKSLGKKTTDRTSQFIAAWTVPYQAGELKVVGYRNKKKVNEATLVTADDPIRLRLTADRTSIKAGGQDLSYVTVELMDHHGIRNPKSEEPLKFEISGNGIIAGLGNANPVSIESFQGTRRKAWQGKALVVVQSGKGTGPVTLKVTCTGLSSAELTIETK